MLKFVQMNVTLHGLIFLWLFAFINSWTPAWETLVYCTRTHIFDDWMISHIIKCLIQWWWDHSESFSVALTAERLNPSAPLSDWETITEHRLKEWGFSNIIVLSFHLLLLLVESEQCAQQSLIRRSPSWCLSQGRIRQPVVVLHHVIAHYSFK